MRKRLVGKILSFVGWISSWPGSGQGSSRRAFRSDRRHRNRVRRAACSDTCLHKTWRPRLAGFHCLAVEVSDGNGAALRAIIESVMLFFACPSQETFLAGLVDHRVARLVMSDQSM